MSAKENLPDLIVSYLKGGFTISVNNEKESTDILNILEPYGILFRTGGELLNIDLYGHASRVNDNFLGKLYYAKKTNYSHKDARDENAWLTWTDNLMSIKKDKVIEFSDLLNPITLLKLQSLNN